MGFGSGPARGMCKKIKINQTQSRSRKTVPLVVELFQVEYILGFLKTTSLVVGL